MAQRFQWLPRTAVFSGGFKPVRRKAIEEVFQQLSGFWKRAEPETQPGNFKSADSFTPQQQSRSSRSKVVRVRADVSYMRE
jgi:hypothetical protein